MGTMWRVRLAARADESIARLGEAIVARLDALVAALSHWEETSALSRFNAAPVGTWHELPVDLAAVIDLAAAIHAASGGAFDPALGVLVDRWGFGPTGAQPVPDQEALRDARARAGWARLRWAHAARRLYQPGGVALDLSAIAKGYAADALAATMAAHGFRHALVEVGGELVGRGMRPDGQPWWVELEAPPGSTLAPFRVALHQCAVATSGTYIRGAHNLDPRTGGPAPTEVVAASVIAATAAEADAWASALLVLGRTAGAQRAIAAGLAARLVTADDEWLSPALAAMLVD